MPVPKVVNQPSSGRHFSAGINTIANLLAATLGPVGGPVANERDHRRMPELLDDSATAVRRILNMADPRMDVGAMMMRSLVWRVGQRAGDGGATAAVLARAIYNEATRQVTAGANAMQLLKGINLGVKAAVESLEAQSRQVGTETDMASVALTVIQDPELAAVLGEMSYLLGADAHVNIEKFVAKYLQQFYHPGAHLRTQIASMYFYTDPIQKRAVLPTGRVAIIDKRIDSINEIVPILEQAVASGAKALTVIAWNFADPVLGVLTLNNRTSSANFGSDEDQQNGSDKKSSEKEDKQKSLPLSILGVKPKAVGDERRFLFDDLALLTGGTVLGREYTTPPHLATIDDLGVAIRTEFSGELLHIVAERQQTVAVQEKAGELRRRLAAMTLDDDDRPVLVKRLSALTGGMGVLKIGAESKYDREVRAQNAERTLKVLSAAQHTGIVPGGGAAYIHAIPALDAVEASDDVALGVEVVRRALTAPARQILDNAHVPSSSVIIERIKDFGPTGAYDALSETVVDSFESGLLDVTGVLKIVLQTAASTATMALSTDTIVYHKKPEQSMSP